MNFESFFDSVRSEDLELKFDNLESESVQGLANEALFHLPLLALTVLLFSKGRRKPRTEQLGQLVGECFERTFPGFKGSSQHLGWSANLRVRTVRALTFLETAKLVDVGQHDSKIIATRLGQKVIAKALDADSDLAVTLHSINRQYRDISVERQLSIEFE